MEKSVLRIYKNFLGILWNYNPAKFQDVNMFFSFLNSNEILHIYLHNAIKYLDDLNKSIGVKVKLDLSFGSTMITESFLWSENEGESFWSIIDGRWRIEYALSHNKEYVNEISR